MSAKSDELCNCDADETWHLLHTSDCAYIRWIDAGKYVNGIRVPDAAPSVPADQEGQER